MSVLDQIKTGHEEGMATLRNNSIALRNWVGSKNDDDIYSNIARVFGEFINDSIGENINSQRAETINKPYVDWCLNNVANFSETLSSSGIQQAFYSMSGISRYNARARQNPSYIVTGRGFGIGYHTDTKSIRTKYFIPALYFSNLTVEHAELIKNKRKREFILDFVKYRDRYVEDIKSLSGVFEVDIPVSLSNVSMWRETEDAKEDRYGYSRSNNYIMFKNQKESKITHLVVDASEPTVWNRQAGPLRGVGNSASGFVVSAINYTNGVIYPMFQLAINYNGDSKSMYSTNACYNVCAEDDSIDGIASFKTNLHSNMTQRIRGSLDYSEIGYNGFPIDLTQIIDNDQFNKVIDRTVGFFGDKSRELKSLKYDNADMYIMFGGF